MEEVITNYIREACERPGNVLGACFHTEHLCLVHRYAIGLCRELDGDTGIVGQAAWLHDIAAILDFGCQPTHAEDGAAIAGRLLREHGYPSDRAERVEDCIRRHSKPLTLGQASLEAVCLSNADAMSQIVNPAYWLGFAMKVKSLDATAARKWYLDRIAGQWASLIEPARTMIASRYHLVTEAIGYPA